MSRKLLSILVLLLLIFGIYNFRQGILDNYVSIYAQDEKDEDKPKKEIDYSKYCWNLYALYKNDDAWKRDLKKFNEDMNELENYIGKITKSKTHLSFGLAIKEKLDIKLNDLSAYAKLNKDLNKNSYEYLSMTEEISKSYSKYVKIISQLELEILKLPDKECNKYFKTLFMFSSLLNLLLIILSLILIVLYIKNNNKINDLNENVKKHNNVIERLYVAETKISNIEHEIFK